MGQDKLKYPITKGPNVHALIRSLDRLTGQSSPADVRFTWTDTDRQVPVAQQASVVQIMIQGLERPQRSNFWKIRAACYDIANRYLNEINVVMIYDPNTR